MATWSLRCAEVDRADTREDGYPVMAAKGALDKGWQGAHMVFEGKKNTVLVPRTAAFIKKLFTKIPKFVAYRP